MIEADDQTPYPVGARILLRDAEWMVRHCTPTEHDGYKIVAQGVSEIVRDEEVVFFTGVEEPELLRPEDTVPVADPTPGFAQSRLFLEAVLRRTPLPQTQRGLALADRFLMDPLTYQLRPAELALKELRPRILLADVVGLGKTLEIGLILAELIRRGRGERILVVTPQQVLEQFQQELWTRFAIPLVRLDSVGIERIQRQIPAGRNPFTYFKRVIISIDTLKNQGRYGRHLENMTWDVVVFDESHNLIGRTSLRNKLARLLAARTDALLLASATPHNGDGASFAELIRMLDPTAIADPKNYTRGDIAHLYLRRTKISPEVSDQIGDRWPKRGPSVPVRLTASEPEERVFEELTRVWLPEAGDGSVADQDRRLFPYTLLKAFLSSHVALASTVAARLSRTKDLGERRNLERLAELAAQVDDDHSAKLRGLEKQLKEIGVGPHNDIRVVVFSESVPTVKWLAKAVPERLGLRKEQVEHILGNEMTDVHKQQVVEKFSLQDSPVRILFTTDAFSEGVNLHRQCHHLIHYDLPWSLIRIEQRNGRIDRYGQKHPPQFTALILTSQVKGAKDDTTVAEKLLRREAQAHDEFGTAEGITGEFTAEKEEDRLTKDLLNGKTVEESVPDKPRSGLLAALLAGAEGPKHVPDPKRAKVPRLFDSTDTYVREALRLLYPDAERTLELDDDGQLISFRPPPDLARRLSALPASYLKDLKVTERMKVTFDRTLAQRKLDEARRTKTLWPEIAYLSDLHPMVEWLTDKILVKLIRQQAPVLLADVPEPTFLVQGIYSNALGQPTVVEWMAITGLPDSPEVEDMIDALTRAGVGPGMINTLREPDTQALRGLVPAAVRAAREYLEKRRADYDERIAKALEKPRQRLVRWQQDSLIGGTARSRIDDTVRQQERLLTSLRSTGEPLLRVLAILESAR